MAAPPTKLIRLKPYDPRRRHLLRSYYYGPTDEQGRPAAEAQRFEEKRGWYKVSERVAKYLAGIHQVESDPDSPLAFDVCTLEEAKAIDAREKKEVERRKTAGEANGDLTTEDIGENRRRADALQAAGTLARVPRGQRAIRRGVRKPSERSMRPVEDEHA